MDDGDDGVVDDDGLHDHPHDERSIGDVNGFEFPLPKGKDPGETALREQKGRGRYLLCWILTAGPLDRG
jgi:hypothetical protein